MRCYELATASIACLASLLDPVGASADSDGYYCLGPEYLAYQFGMAAPSPRDHVLHVVPLRADQLLAEPAVLELPKFQVHGMLCDEASVRIVGWDAVYTIRLDSAQQPTGFVREPLLQPGVIPAEFTGRAAPANLGMLSRTRADLIAQRTELLRDPSGRRFAIETVANLDRTTSCSTEIITRIVELGSDGELMRSREIFRGLVGRECGGHEPKRHSAWRRFSSLSRALIERVATVPRAQAACCGAGVQMAAEGVCWGYRRRSRQATSHPAAALMRLAAAGRADGQHGKGGGHATPAQVAT